MSAGGIAHAQNSIQTTQYKCVSANIVWCVEGLSKPLHRLKRKLTVENLWIYVIATLLVEPTYAYRVKKLVNEFFEFSPTTITLYSVIYRLSKSGLIKEETVAGGKIYRPTKEGVKELEEAVFFMEDLVTRLKKLLHSNKSEEVH